MNKQLTLDVGAELRDAHGRLNDAVGRLAAFAAIAERLGKLPEEIDLPAADVIVRYGAPPGDNADQLPGEPEEVRDNFAAYCARFAVVGMVTACEEFLLRVLLVANVGKFAAGSGGGLTGNEFNAIREQTRKEVRNTSIDRLPLRILAAVHRESTTVQELAWFRGIYGTRTCLLHRGGLVSKDDVDDTGVLNVTWRKPIMRIGDTEVTALPASAEAGDKVLVELVDAVHVWQIGDSVVFTAQDCQEIALTLSLFCGRISSLFGEGVVELIKRKIQS